MIGGDCVEVAAADYVMLNRTKNNQNVIIHRPRPWFLHRQICSRRRYDITDIEFEQLELEYPAVRKITPK